MRLQKQFEELIGNLKDHVKSLPIDNEDMNEYELAEFKLRKIESHGDSCRWVTEKIVTIDPHTGKQIVKEVRYLDCD